MKVSREDHVDPTASKLRHGHVSSPYNVTFPVGISHIKRVMRNKDSRALFLQTSETATALTDLFRINATILKCQRSGGIDSQNGYFLIDKKWLDVLVDITPIVFERGHPSGKYIVKRYIMVSGHDNLGLCQGVEECTRGGKLPCPGALR
jgi:hypothetical protein